MDDKKVSALEKMGVAFFGAMIGAAATYLAQENNRELVKEKTAKLVKKGEDRFEDLLDEVRSMSRREKKRLLERLEE